jgi:hypothetical protein
MARPRTPADRIALRSAGQQALLAAQSEPSAALAHSLGVTPAAVFLYRTGRARPSGPVARKLQERYPTVKVWMFDVPPFASDAARERAVRSWSRAS